MMRKILIVITTAFVPYGGLATVMLNYYRHMNREGLQIDFASTNPLGEEDSLSQELRGNHSRYYCLGERKRGILLYTRRLYSLLKKEKYDVIHVNGNSATMAIELKIAKWAGVPVRIAHCHTSRSEHTMVHKCLLPVFRRSYTKAGACSAMAGVWLFEHFDILKNAIDFEKYRFRPRVRNQVRERLGITGKFVIGTVGKINVSKNQVFFLDVLQKFVKQRENTLFLLVGDGPERGNLEQKIREKGLEHHVLLPGMRTDVDELLNGMDCFVFPSFFEGFGMAMLEAQANGLWCLASDQVSREGVITDHVCMLPLQEPDRWVGDLMQAGHRDCDVEKLRKIFETSGYEIGKSSEVLRQWYLD